MSVPRCGMAVSTRPEIPGSGNETARRVFTDLPRRYDRLCEWLSFGQNARWRAALVGAIAAARPGLVLDVATGTAGVALAINKATGTRVVGADLDAGMLARGAANVSRTGTDTVLLARCRGEQLPFPDATFDALSFTYLLRYVDDPAGALRELVRVVRPGGVIASLEFCVPEGPLRHPAWRAYTRGVLPLAGLLTGGPAWWKVGRFLGPSISGYYASHPVEEIVPEWQRAGIDAVTVRVMSLGGGVVVWGKKR